MNDADAIERCLAAIAPLDGAARDAAVAEMNDKLKPPGSLGRLEELACRVAGIRGVARPAPPTAAVVICAADHGVAEESVSAYPREVTGLMLSSFASGGAAICVLSRDVGARLVVADLGVLEPPAAADGSTEILDLRVRPGTANSAVEPAMSLDEVRRAVAHGIDLAGRLIDDGVDLVALGEMGIGNTTTASALTAALLGCDASEVCGRGTGLDDEGVRHKEAVVSRVLARHQGVDSPVGILAAMGGLEVACLVGVIFGCAARRVPVVLDGFITTAAALVAAAWAPSSVDVMIAGHLSEERAHALQLEALGLEPVLALGLRLGEGTGAALAVGVVRAAVAVLADMASFTSLGLGPDGA